MRESGLGILLKWDLHLRGNKTVKATNVGRLAHLFWLYTLCFLDGIGLSLITKISRCSSSNVTALALSPSNSLTPVKPVKPKEKITAVLSAFNVQEGPAKRLQTLMIVAVEIGSFFLIP